MATYARSSSENGVTVDIDLVGKFVKGLEPSDYIWKWKLRHQGHGLGNYERGSQRLG